MKLTPPRLALFLAVIAGLFAASVKQRTLEQSASPPLVFKADAQSAKDG
ncbi:MAG: hypothetical protein AAB388_00460 [Patescibacteria group bacterium]